MMTYKVIAVVILSVLFMGTGSPVFAQTDYGEKIQSLERELEEIKASVRANLSIVAMIGVLFIFCGAAQFLIVFRAGSLGEGLLLAVC